MGLWIAAFAGARASAVVLCRSDVLTDQRQRLDAVVRLLLFGTVVVGTLAIYALYPLASTLVTELGLDTGRTELLAAANATAMTGTAVVGLLAVRRGQRPFRRWLREEPLTVDPAFRRRRWLADTVALFALTLVVQFDWYGLLPGDFVWTFPAAIVVWVGYLTLIEPLQAVTADSVRDPTEDERARIDRCYDRFGCNPGSVFVFSGSDPQTALRVVGRKAVRAVWVHDGFLDRVTDDELAVALAQAEGRSGPTLPTYFRLVAAVGLVGIVLGAFGYYTGANAFVDAAFAAFVLAFPLFLYYSYRGRNRVVHSDRFASERLGADTVRSAYRSIGSELGIIPEAKKDTVLPDRLNWLTIIEPSINYRIERLEREYGLDPAPTGDDRPAGLETESGGFTDASAMPTATVEASEADIRAANTVSGRTDGDEDDERTLSSAAETDRLKTAAASPDATTTTTTSASATAGTDGASADPNGGGAGNGTGGPPMLPHSYWRWVVLLSTVLWAAVFVAIGAEIELVSEMTLGGLLIGSWLGIPIGIYADSKGTQSAAGWPKYRKTVVVLAAIWLVNVVVGLWYVAKRPPSRPRSASDPTDGPDSIRTGTYSRKRLVAAVGLLAVGLVLTASFGIIMGDMLSMSEPAEVESFDPETELAQAAVAPAVLDLEDELTDAPADVERAVEEAAANGTYESDGDHPDELEAVATVTWFGEPPSYAVYEGEYYEWEGSVADGDGELRIELEPTTTSTVMDDVATPYGEANELEREVVDDTRDSGLDTDPNPDTDTDTDPDSDDEMPVTDHEMSVTNADDTVDEGVPNPGIVVDNGTYYAISSPAVESIAEDEWGFARQLLLGGFSALLTPVGIAFTVVGSWLTARLFRRESTTIGGRTGLSLALIAAVVAAVVSATSSTVFVVQNALLAGGVVLLATAGHYRDRGRRRRMRNLLLAIPAVVVLGSVLAAGPAGLFFAVVGLVPAGLVGWPLLIYGSRFSDDAASEEPTAVDSRDSGRSGPTDGRDSSTSDESPSGTGWHSSDGDTEFASDWPSSDEADGDETGSSHDNGSGRES
ncbi:hypothetical protein [Natrialba magadii]|uniref:hypothetical protein n=1 Tax=Natrialba magadii TaxID=13769 RepID=UPI001F46C49C|nr:hypothetical protein [Natrialba magadii]